MTANGATSEGNSPEANDTTVLDAQLGDTLRTLSAINGLRGIADIAQDVLANPGTTLSPVDIDRKLRSESNDALNTEEQYAVHEMNIMLAKYGQTPVNSVEGLVKLRKMLVRIYKDNELVPAATRNELAVLERNLLLVERTRDLYIHRKILEEETKSSAAELELLRHQAGIKDARVELEAKDIDHPTIIDSRRTRALETTVENKKQTGMLRNDEKVLNKVVDNDRLEKTIDARRHTIKIVWGKAISPVLIPLLKIAIVVVLIGMTFAFFVEQSETPMYPPFGADK